MPKKKKSAKGGSASGGKISKPVDPELVKLEAKQAEEIETVHPKEVEVEEPVKVVIEEKPTEKKVDHKADDLPWYKHHHYIILLSIVAVLVLGAAALGAYWYQQQEPNETVTTVKGDGKKKKSEKSTTAARRLDGLVVANADANRTPVCVMIENAAFDGVRPQAGLSAAGVVYEIIVEGGITRLMAVYGGESADNVGPVRSARDTYLEFVSEYNCAYAHAGGSYTAMNAIYRFALRDVDGLMEPKWFWRDSSKYSPHNLFTNTANLYEATDKGHSWTDAPVYASWNFVDDDQLKNGVEANTVTIDYGGSYNVKYVYNTVGKFYERWNGNVLQTDANTGKTLTTRNIVIEHVPAGEYIEGKGRINFSVTGEGKVQVFRNGILTEGMWKKADRLDRTRYYDDAGVEIPLARGTTWVEIVPEGYTFGWE